MTRSCIWSCLPGTAPQLGTQGTTDPVSWLQWLPVWVLSSPSLAAVSPWQRACPAAASSAATSSTTFVFPAFVSCSALAAGQARHPFQSSLCFIGEIAGQKYTGFKQGENSISLLFFFPPAKMPSLGRAVTHTLQAAHPLAKSGQTRVCARCAVSDGQEQAGGDIFFLSPTTWADLKFSFAVRRVIFRATLSPGWIC